MTERLGRGPYGSLSGRVDREILELRRENVALRRARYSLGRRLLRATVVGRTVVDYLFLYSIVLGAAVFVEWAISRYILCRLPKYSDAFESGFLKDLGSYLIAGQIGVLAIVSVAVAVVTLLSERTDGASVNTDIRLYYVESYSYELAISGVALLLILTFQMFWPLQHILNAIGRACGDDWFKLTLSAIHALWFGVNLLLFLQFITTTLRFVEPSTREALREGYSANEVIPRDAKARLLRSLFFNAPAHLFGGEALKQGPAIAFGYGSSLNEGARAELMTTFRAPARLVDVRLRPLRWALARWQQRVRQQPQRGARFGQSFWDSYLTITPNFDDVLDGQCNLVLRRGDVALSGLEKWVIRRCFRFAPVSSRTDDMPTPDNFLEQLVDKLVRQIEQTAATGFRAALDEVIRYHRFILATQNTKDEAGNAFNFAEIGGYVSRPDAEWVRQYRRAFVAAVDRIGTDTSFIDRLSTLAARLIPDDGLHFSQRVIQTLLELGIHEVVSLEDWVTRRSVIGPAVEPGTSPALAGSDKRAYEDVLRGFVGGWETLSQVLISSLSLERHPSNTGADAQWKVFTKGFPVLQAHLHCAAYFLAAAVWNNDALGADRFRDLLLRWLQPFYANLQASYMFGNTLLLTPELTTKDWPTVHSEVVARMLYRQEAALPGPVSGLLLWELHCDVVCVSGLVALHWYASGQQPSNTAAEVAILTLRRQKRAGDGSDLTQITPKSVFRLVFDFLIRYALNPRFAEGSYSADIDGLVRRLTNLASPRVVSGRIYGGYGIDGVETLRPVLLATLAANLPTQGDDGANNVIDDLEKDSLFAADDSVRNFIWTMRQMIQALDHAQESEVYVKAAKTFSGDLDLTAATARLRLELTGVVKAFEALRAERLRNAPLDESRMSLVRRKMTEEVLARGPSITCFTGFHVRRDNSATIPVSEVEFGVMDRGAFTQPYMSAFSFGDLPGHFVNALRSGLSNFLWREFQRHPKRVVSVDISESNDAFWRQAISEAAGVGPDPVVLVPIAGIGEEVTNALIMTKMLAEMNVSRDAAMPTGGGTGYLGTVGGVAVYGAQIPASTAFLCSGSLVRTISYGVVHGRDDVADFSFVDSVDPEKSQVRLKFAQRIEWASEAFVEFTIDHGNEAKAKTEA
jgi:hypothetical protein